MSFDEIRVAKLSELTTVVDLYKTACEHQPLDQYGADWTWGEYPSADGLQQYIERGQLIVGFKGQQAIAAGVLTTGEEYPDVDWPTKVGNNDQIGVVHLISVHPAFRGQGLSKSLMGAILTQAKREGKLVIHLDVLADNLPSEKLYEKVGFKLVKKLIIHYDDIGDRAAKVMEYQLSE